MVWLMCLAATGAGRLTDHEDPLASIDSAATVFRACVRFPRDAGVGDRGSDGFHERSPDDACPEEVPEPACTWFRHLAYLGRDPARRHASSCLVSGPARVSAFVHLRPVFLLL